MESLDVDAALKVWREEGEGAYFGARVIDYFEDDGTPRGYGTREEALAAMRAEDERAEGRNRDLMRRAILAALDGTR